MSLKERLAIDSLRNDINEVSSSLAKLEDLWGGRSWKFPNQQSSDIDIAQLFSKFNIRGDSDSGQSQLSLLELLVDRLHLLILSCSKISSDSFCPIGKAADALINHVKILSQRPVSAGYVGGDGGKGSLTTYSPNYEEDVRREMFPFVQSLVTSVNAICKKYVIPCTAHETWQRENRNLDKKTFVTVTGCIRADIDRLAKIFDGFDKITHKLQAQILKEQKETKRFKISNDSMKATLARERKTLELESKQQKDDLEHEKNNLRLKIDMLTNEHRSLSDRFKQKSKELTCVKSTCEETETKATKEMEQRKRIEASLDELKVKFQDITNQLKESKLANNKMKSRLIELSEFEQMSIKSADEKSLLSEKLQQHQNLIESLRQEIQIEHENSQCHLSKIEHFKLQVKNATSCTRCCRHETEIHTMKRSMNDLRAEYEEKSVELSNLKIRLENAQSNSDEWREKATLMATYPDLTMTDVRQGPTDDSVEGQMNGQIKANQCRIKLLQGENEKLRSVIEKIAKRPISVMEVESNASSNFHDSYNFDDNVELISPSLSPWPSSGASVRSNQSQRNRPNVHTRSRRVASPLYPSRSHAVSRNIQCVQWNAGR